MRLSVITVCYNAAETIKDTIESVLAQKNVEDLEYIVVDGNSNDGSVDIIKSYGDSITQFISEPDKGLYDAINKGIRMATGDVIGLLHADDLYYSDTVLSSVENSFKSHGVDCLYGNLHYVDKNNTDKIVRNWRAGTFTDRSFVNGWMPPHPTFFVKKECYEKYGLYDTSFKTAADYELMLRFLKKEKLSACYLDETMIKMRVGGKSNQNLKNRINANKEDAEAWSKNGLELKKRTRILKPVRKIPQLSISYYSEKFLASIIIIDFLFFQFSSQIEQSMHLFNPKLLFAFVTSWLISLLATPVIIKIAKIKNLTDKPNERSAHNNAVPTMGGMALFASVLLGITIWAGVNSINSFQYVIGALTIIFFTGLKDDILALAPDKKFAAQFIAASIIVYGCDVRIGELFGIFWLGQIPYIASAIISVVVILAITNAYNLIDGIDGLAGSMGILATAAFGGYFAIVGYTDLAILAFSTTGALIAFLKFNFSRDSKIFLGDTGSLIIGFIVSILAIKFLQVNEGGGNAILPVRNAPSIMVAIILIPLYDMLRVFTLRLLKKKSPFFPDKTHIHHLLVKRDLSHARASTILFVANALFITICFFTISNISAFQSFAGFFGLLILYIVGLSFLDRQKSGYFTQNLGSRFPVVSQVLAKKKGKEKIINVAS